MTIKELIVLDVAKNRGIVLNQLIHLERIIDELLSRYFCAHPQQRRDLMLLILCTNKITFDSKKLVLRFIIEHRFKSFFDANPLIWNYFEDIIPERNKMAHYLLDTSGDYVEQYQKNQSFKLVNFDVGIKNTGEKEILYSPEKIKEIVGKIEFLDKLFWKFIKENLPLPGDPESVEPTQ